MARRSNPLNRVVVILLLIALAVGGGFFVRWKLETDAKAKAVATTRARARFVTVKAAMEQRLHQPHPIQLGAVWATHTGRICGLVYGEGSFSGLTGMTPFYADGNKPTFALDTDPDAFAPDWVACGQDIWVVVVPGSTEEGVCGVPKYASRCHYTDKRQVAN
jgi:hypothetical protein